MELSGTQARRAALISRRSTGFFSGSKQSSPEPSQLMQALRIVRRCFWLIFEPVTRFATFCSSITFQSMNCSMSGWSVSTITILAARRVVPPDLIAPAARSPILRKLIRPEERPPPESLSRSEEHTSELQSRRDLVCRLLLEKKKHNRANTCPDRRFRTIVYVQ